MRIILSPPEYRALRIRVFSRQGWRCRDCGRIKPLDLAHIKGRGTGGGFREDTEENTCGLCRGCHNKSGYEKSKFVVNDASKEL